MTVPERLQLFLDSQDVNAYRVNKQAGLSKGLLTKALQGRKGLSSQSLEQILLAYPELDADWLMTGRGEMIRNEKPEVKTPPLPEDLDRSLYRTLLWHFSMQDNYQSTHAELERVIQILAETDERLASIKTQLKTILSLIETQWQLQPSEEGIWRMSLKIAAGDDGRTTPPPQLKELADLEDRIRKYLVPETKNS